MEQKNDDKYLTRQEFQEFLDDYEDLFDEQCKRDDINQLNIQTNKKDMEELKISVDQLKKKVDDLWYHLDNGYRQKLVEMLMNSLQNLVNTNNSSVEKVLLEKIESQENTKIQWYKYVIGGIQIQVLQNVDKIFQQIKNLIQ